MVLVAFECPFCGSDDVRKFGKIKGKQRYECKTQIVHIKPFMPSIFVTDVIRITLGEYSL